ncbi:MAG TPA: hypothetical protein VE981_03990 [Planctomycetota bacterium]|nr:hypothetical protein [Planctomycetota bacterium]
MPDSIRVLTLGEVRSAVSVPSLIVLGLDLEGQTLKLFEEASRLLPWTNFARAEIMNAPEDTRVLFGQPLVLSARVVFLNGGVLLGELESWRKDAKDLVAAIVKADAIDPVQCLREATAWLAEAAPAGADLAQLAPGRYRTNDYELDCTISLEGDGSCTHEEQRGGFNGCVTTTKAGSWSRAGEGILEFHWTHWADDTEAGLDRTKGQENYDLCERADFGWKGGRLHELRFPAGRLPSLQPPKERYFRV